jgi:hypothetical protein
MRVALVVALMMLSSCASEKLALAPPPGVDFSGQWKLNEADSDDPQRLVLSQLDGAANGSAGTPGSRGGQGGRGGGRGGRGGGGGPSAGGAGAPSVPAVGALTEGLRWPGKELEIKQVAGVVAITSAGVAQVYQPVADMKPHHHRKKPADDDGQPRGRDMRARTQGDGPPPLCGWDDKTLVVQSGDPDDDHPPFEERYSVSEDGQRLIEVVGFKGGRSGGFTMSRVWDREARNASPGDPRSVPPGAPSSVK